MGSDCCKPDEQVTSKFENGVMTEITADDLKDRKKHIDPQRVTYMSKGNNEYFHELEKNNPSKIHSSIKNSFENSSIFNNFNDNQSVKNLGPAEEMYELDSKVIYLLEKCGTFEIEKIKKRINTKPQTTSEKGNEDGVSHNNLSKQSTKSKSNTSKDKGPYKFSDNTTYIGEINSSYQKNGIGRLIDNTGS